MLLINQQINSNTKPTLHLHMTWSNSNSVSRIRVVLEAREKGKITLELVRHLSPITFLKIIKAMPISGRLHFLDRKLGYVETGLTVGAEKQKSTFQRGSGIYDFKWFHLYSTAAYKRIKHESHWALYRRSINVRIN